MQCYWKPLNRNSAMGSRGRDQQKEEIQLFTNLLLSVYSRKTKKKRKMRCLIRLVVNCEIIFTHRLLSPFSQILVFDIYVKNLVVVKS